VSRANGVDWDCGGDASWYVAAARSKALAGDVWDRSLERLFTALFKLGTFDSPDVVAYKRWGIESVDTPEHRALARVAASQSIVLLGTPSSARSLTPPPFL
jgi:beta-glucosidase-like glycosyl hydrolase